MVDPTLQSYVDSSLAAGFSYEQIREALLQSGWDPMSVAEALPPPVSSDPVASPPTPLPLEPSVSSNKKPSRRRKLFRITAITLLAVLVLSGGLITFAEQGYIPTVSRLYRKTLAPLAWKGTTGSPEATIVQVAEAMSTVTTVHEESSLTISAKVADPQASVSLEKWPKLASYLALTAKKDNRTLATVDTDTDYSTSPDRISFSDDDTVELYIEPSPLGPLGFDPASYLPATVSLTSVMDIDDKQNFHLKINTDLGDLVDKIGSLFPGSQPLARTSDNEGFIIHDSKKAFVKSPLIPYLSPEDNGKFLFFDLPDSFFEGTEKQDELPETVEKEKNKLKKEELEAWRAVASVIWKDKGVVRRDGNILAHYEVSLNPSLAQEIDKLPAASSCKCTIDTKSVIDSKSSLTLNIYVEQRSQRLSSLDFTLESTPVGSNITINASFKINLQYVLPTPITSPDPSLVIEEEGTSYYERIFEQMMGGYDPDAPMIDPAEPESGEISSQLESARLRARNAERKTTITELGKALELHKYTDENLSMSVPSTNGLLERLDNPQGVFAQNPGLLPGLTFPLLDPEPDKYYYSYISDGTSYTVSCVVTSDTDPNTIVSLYKIEDGIVKEVPYP